MHKSLQGTRGIAAVMVVLFHLGGAFAADKYFGIGAFAFPFRFGSSSVEFFFVISGFIIFSAHNNDLFQKEKFLKYVKNRTNIPNLLDCFFYWCF